MPGFGLKRFTKSIVSYNDLTYYKKDEFINSKLTVSKRIKWSVEDTIIGFKVLLTEETGSGFYALVLACDVEYYKETSIYITNPFAAYVI